eukprot:3991285-Alexandrium_andersonii.AAC.1
MYHDVPGLTMADYDVLWRATTHAGVVRRTTAYYDAATYCKVRRCAATYRDVLRNARAYND